MTLDVSRFLEVAAVHLLTRSLPAVGDAYEQSALGALAVLLSVVREDFDRAAELDATNGEFFYGGAQATLLDRKRCSGEPFRNGRKSIGGIGIQCRERRDVGRVVGEVETGPEAHLQDFPSCITKGFGS